MTNLAQSFKQVLNILKTEPSSSCLDRKLKQLTEALHQDSSMHCLALISQTDKHQLLLISALAQLLKLEAIKLYIRSRLKGDAFWLLAKSTKDELAQHASIQTVPSATNESFFKQAA